MRRIFALRSLGSSLGLAVLIAASASTAVAQDGMPVPAGMQQGRVVLMKSLEAYKAVPGLTDRVEIDLTMPDGSQSTSRMGYVLGTGTDASVSMRGLEAFAQGDRVLLIKEDVHDKYVQVALERDLGTTLESVFRGGIVLPAPVSMRAGRAMKVWLDGLTLGAIPDAQIRDHATVKGADGKPLHEVTLGGETGTSRVRIDPETLFVRKVSVEASVPGMPPESRVKAEATFAPRVHASAAGLVAFDPSGRTRVSGVSKLQPTPVAKGDVAPDFELAALDGRTVKLSDLRGSVVVLDFWATWCPPCRRGLPLLQQFATRAAAGNEPVEVFAINTGERAATADARREAAARYWEGQKFTMPTLLDLDSKVASVYGYRSIPVTVVVGRDGVVTAVHNGFDPRMVDTLEKDVAAALGTGG